MAINRYVIYFSLASIGCALDLLSKSWVFARVGSVLVEDSQPRPAIWLIDGIFGFDTSLNEGALFGLGQGWGMTFVGLSLVAVIGVVYWLFYLKAAEDPMLTTALGVVSGGILGNLYDRLGLPGLKWADGIQGHQKGEPIYAVRDWLHFKIDAINFDWPIFNLADCMLVCGAAVLCWHAFRQQPQDSPEE